MYHLRLLPAVAALSLFSGAAIGAESATSVYLLGSKGSMAGFVPPPGVYVVDANYFYSGDASGTAALGVTLRRSGARNTGGIPIQLEADVSVDASAYYQMPTAVWVTPEPVLGGNLGFSIITPIGWKDVSAQIDARATVTLPPPLSRTITAGRSFSFGDEEGAFGDPLVSAFLGWHQGNLHYSLGTLINIPAGQWDQGQIANIGFNHWAFDITGAVTWLDMTTGLELSGAVGVTFNTENHDTDYKSGTDLHFEFAAMQNLSKQFAIGIAGYHYQQISGDSGSGAVLGDFKGRVTAIGPAINYNFQIGALPVSTSLKWSHEFNTENRLSGDAGLLTILIPLGPPPAGGH